MKILCPMTTNLPSITGEAMNIETRIQGIPAIVRVDHSEYSPPDYRADNPTDYYGGWSISFTICDRNGRPAKWLIDKLNQAELAELEQEIISKMEIEEAMV